MIASENVGILHKSFEGLVLKASRCPAGQLTIGYGHARGVKEGAVITKEQANQFLEQDINHYSAYINESIVKKLGYELTQGQFDALVSLAMNIGRISPTSKLYEALINQNLVKAVEQLLLYSKSNGAYMLGLHRRRFAEALLFTGMIVNEADKGFIRNGISHIELNQKGMELLKWYEKEQQ